MSESESVRYRVNSSVVGEFLEGEVVLINMDNGNYYSMEGVAAVIWELVQEQATVSEIVSRLTELCGTGDDIEGDVMDLMETLTGEALIEEAGGKVESPAGRPEDSAIAFYSGRPSGLVYKTPVLSRYTDMDDLLVLDPIHETDETGWPNKA